ncbi:MAG: hypothetical protein JWP78_620 [Mucilaginibacter sp.]|nr:hypothetical protein [Mucilaginibacter sp.]
MVDLVYDLVLNKPDLHPGFSFNADASDPAFSTWYKSDNVYLQEIASANPTQKAALQAESDAVEVLIRGLLANISQASALLDNLKTLSKSPGNLGSEVITLLSDYGSLSASEIQTKVNTLITNYGAVFPAGVNSANIQTAVTALQADYDHYKFIYGFYAQLKKSDFKDFTLTQDQYYGLKYITQDFLKLVRNQFKNDVVGSVLDFLIENTIIEYNNAATNTQVTEQTATINDKGYIYIDIESLVSQIEQHFAPSDKKTVYLSVFFSLGTNQASFLNSNSLAVDANNNPKSLGNLYYASEKIGLKYKFWNWAYTHSFQPGENFNYYNAPGTSPRSWLRPQQQPTISDFYIMVYGSGLLYNLVNLKSDDKFNYAIAGAGLGITFFNGLSLNVGLACPYTDKRFKSENTFINFGIDIPIIDYIAALAKK